MVDDSGGKPPPIIHYLSSVYVMRGGYFHFLELMGCFVFFTIIDVIKNVYPIFEILFYYSYPCDEPNDFVLSIFIFMERVKKIIVNVLCFYKVSLSLHHIILRFL